MKTTCKTEGCDKKARARGMCATHWAAWKADTTPCSVEGCSRGTRSRGMCAMHYYRLRNHGEVGPAEPTRKHGHRPCRVEDCANGAVTSDDLCPTHRRRKQLYGNEDGSFATHKKCLTCGSPATATDRSSDYCRTHYIEYVKGLVARREMTGSRSPNGYVYVNIFKRRYAEHAIIMESMLGRPMKPGENVHHKNGVRADNRVENLELWVKPQPYGQRVEDLVQWVVDNYPAYVAAAMNGGWSAD